MNKEQFLQEICIILAGFFVMLFAGIFVGCGPNAAEFLLETEMDESLVSERAETVPDELPEPTQEARKIYIDVEGAVRNPGVYELEEGSRVFQALEAAGGFLPDAAPQSVNQAAYLVDGQQIWISMTGEDSETALTSGTQDGRINLNHATAEELCTLPGIGSAKAEAILRYREEQGMFASVEELMQVEGIKEGTFQKIKNKITI